MAVKIDDSMKKAAGLAISPSTARSGKTAESPAPATPSTVATDNVSISPQLKTLSSTLAAQGAFDAGKVEEIKSAIAEGRFQVNAEKIADGLIDSVKEMIHSRKS